MASAVIEKVTTQIVDLPLKQLYGFSATTINSKSFLLLRIQTRNGLRGQSQALPTWLKKAGIGTVKSYCSTNE
jgi:hypothetical protein